MIALNDAPHRIARGCTEAAIGYATAATAAYTGLAGQMLDFWCTALSGLSDEPPAPATSENNPYMSTKAATELEPAFGMSMADWCPFPLLDARRFEAFWRLDPLTPPGMAMLAMANAVPLRGTSASWGMARVMIDSGVPRAVAWPAAEANAAALDAADAASQSMTKVLAHFHSENGFATATRSMTPSLLALAGTLAASMPFTSFPVPWVT